MLDNIKSVFFQRIVFSKLNDERKLKLVKYNKSFQNRLNINILNYKIFSGKYISYEVKDKRKEYDISTDFLLFEEDYINGIGKEYSVFGSMKFEGEYFKGQRNGKGRQFYVKGDVSFEGEYYNGKKNGYGREYYKNGVIKFEGEYINGFEWTGKGYDISNNLIYELNNGKGFCKEFDSYTGKLNFEGEYLNGKRNGKGKEYDWNGKKIFEGEYLNGLRWKGVGYDREENVVYEIKDGRGIIKEFDPDNKISFEGEYIYGQKNGKGKEYDNGKILFDGEFLESKYKKGKKYYDEKLMFDGEFLYGRKRKGKSYINGILEYEGEFLFDKKWNGKGYDENGNIIYELINGNGYVKEYDNYGKLEYEGEYLNGKRNGKGKEYDYNGKLIFEGEFINGERN